MSFYVNIVTIIFFLATFKNVRGGLYTCCRNTFLPIGRSSDTDYFFYLYLCWNQFVFVNKILKNQF